MRVSAGEAFGRRCEAWGAALGGNGTAGAPAGLVVKARDLAGNALPRGGDQLAVYAFHSESEVSAVSGGGRETPGIRVMLRARVRIRVGIGVRFRVRFRGSGSSPPPPVRGRALADLFFRRCEILPVG